MNLERLISIIFFALILSSCNPRIEKNTVLGSWYHFDNSNNEYREIHIDDSLFIYIYDNAEILLPYDYLLEDDTFYLGVGLDSIVKKYKVSHSKRSEKKIILKDEYEKLVFTKMDTIIDDLNNGILNFDSLERFSYNYYNRKMIYLEKTNKKHHR